MTKTIKTIKLLPTQGVQTELGKMFLYNAGAVNTVIEQINTSAAETLKNATNAAESAQNAAQSAKTALTEAGRAVSQATAAADSAQNALSQKTAAEKYAIAAKSSATAAAESAKKTEQNEMILQGYVDTAKKAATMATSNAASAKSSADAAADSSSRAAQSAKEAADAVMSRVKPATAGQLGGVIVGDSLNVDTSGTINISDENQEKINKAISEKNITNCITEIPQDIKLELNNGTLTLKAGSKVYVPNGFESDGTTPKFDEVTISTDKQNTTSTSTSGTGVVFYNTISNTLFFKWDNQVSSGTSDITNYIVYRTDLNKISDGGAYGRSFPLGIITVTSGTITSIDQVFNGFGYIGSTVFALSGVKGLVPNGRNADGTLKNVSWTTSSIILRTYSTAYNGEYDIFFNGGAFGALKNTYIYDEESNYNMDSNNRYNSTYIGRAYITSGTISYFATKNAFHAVDYSEYLQTKKSLDNKASELDNKVSEKVNKSGDTMTGNLGMNDGDVIFKDTQTAIAPSADTWHKCIVQFLDKNNVRVGWIQPFFKPDGTMELRLVSYDPVNGNKYLNLGSNGNLVWDGKPVITTAGGTFTSNIAIQKETPQINLKSTVMDITSGGWAAGRNTVAWCMDKNGYESAGVYNTTDTGGTARMAMYVMSRKSGSQVQASLGVGVNSSGQAYATAPNTPDGAGTNEVVTAKWAKDKFVRIVAKQDPTSENSHTWYRKYSDGWVEQGGIHYRPNGNTVNLPVAMSNEYYDIQLTCVNGSVVRFPFGTGYTSTHFTYGTADDASSNNDGYVRWYVCGYAAS